MPDQLPIVSVVIPARDAAGFILRAVRSVRRQSLRRVEILPVDDASSDATWRMMLEEAAQDPRLRPLRRPQAGGVSAARNTGLDAARGRYVTFLDADDRFRPRRLARLVAFAEATGAELVADDLRRHWFEAGRPIDRHLGAPAIAALPQPLGLADLIARDMPGMPDAQPRQLGYLKPVFRRDFLLRRGLRFAEGLHAGEDLLLYAECVAAGGRFHVTESADYRYAVRFGSLSNRPGIAHGQAAANRRLLSVAARAGDAAAFALLRRRQAALDHAALADAAMRGHWLDALSYANWARPQELATDLRVVAGAARRRVVG
ncbi:glycosyltransferase family 2 protein [Falsiroseomonas sp. CW058]|uniref:glycosyltransferase family 2 protein n=1 Tax=Falsiroseomonas sp. CW058 TaxID=3388664 RepID=UPI003D30F662